MVELPTYEEATTCPKCARHGDVRMRTPAPRGAGFKPGTMIHHVYCVTELCRWYNTPWTVQVNPDGTIPAPKNHTGGPKVYDGFKGHEEQALRLIASLERQAKAETTGTGETRGL